ncbi:hypothetical protein B0H63DRAFT_560790 [Podospora didyma]|uniref:Uncharacterized protein n=1 Tax=Podospora didyma TaxID=330526 RepID=A0AAE0NGE2_9PEZI|nr:hypothetical protein B0H63DRAFT_560790 [Podospora didyma]
MKDALVNKRMMTFRVSRMNLLILTLSSLFAWLVAAQSTTSIQTGSPLPTNGFVDTSLLPKWEISYQTAVDSYLPVCGESFEIEGDDYWSNSPECRPALTSFQSSASATAMLKVQVYNTSGAVTTDPIGNGRARSCLCFAVVFTPEDDSALDLCLLISPAGEVMIKNGVAVGLQAPEDDLSRTLPRCKDYRGPESGGGSGGGLSQQAVIALAVSVPVAVVAMGTLVVLWIYRRQIFD